MTCDIGSLPGPDAAGQPSGATVTITADVPPDFPVGAVTNTATTATPTADPGPGQRRRLGRHRRDRGGRRLGVQDRRSGAARRRRERDLHGDRQQRRPVDGPRRRARRRPSARPHAARRSSPPTCTGAPQLSCPIGDLDPGATATATVVMNIPTNFDLGRRRREHRVGHEHHPRSRRRQRHRHGDGDHAGARRSPGRQVGHDRAPPPPGTPPGTFQAGAIVTYFIAAVNLGPSDASSVRIVDTLPPGVTFVSVQTPEVCAFVPPNQVVCELPVLLAQRRHLRAGHRAPGRRPPRGRAADQHRRGGVHRPGPRRPGLVQQLRRPHQPGHHRRRPLRGQAHLLARPPVVRLHRAVVGPGRDADRLLHRRPQRRSVGRPRRRARRHLDHDRLLRQPGPPHPPGARSRGHRHHGGLLVLGRRPGLPARRPPGVRGRRSELDHPGRRGHPLERGPGRLPEHRHAHLADRGRRSGRQRVDRPDHGHRPRRDADPGQDEPRQHRPRRRRRRRLRAGFDVHVPADRGQRPRPDPGRGRGRRRGGGHRHPAPRVHRHVGHAVAGHMRDHPAVGRGLRLSAPSSDQVGCPSPRRS